MKSIIKFTACIFLIWLVYISSCKKEENYPIANHPPVARAGPDLFVELPSCSDRTGFAELNGSGSSDPDNNIVSYRWTKVSGPEGFIIRNSASAKARVERILPGEYSFELMVTDKSGAASRDTMQISVKGLVKEFDLDITFNASFEFNDNYKDCGFYNYFYYGSNCLYYDFTVINGKGNFLPFGEFNLYMSETADTAASSNVHNTYIRIYVDNNGNGEFLNGSSSVNFKRLIQQGGGSFNGTFNVTDGSAIACDPNALISFFPLSVTGSLDVATRTVTLRIKGKTYF